MNDSLGNPDPHAYNAAHWDGSQWELKRIMFYTICGQQNLSSYPARSIQIFNENDIWIGVDGDQITRIENGVQTTTICLPWSFTINKIWGTSSEDLYVVGNGGNIAHYSGVSGGWQKIESGTELNINDIWGDYNDKTGEWEILAVAANIFQGFDKEVLKITNDNVEILNKNGIEEPLFGIWFIPNRKYYLVGSGTYEKFKLHQNIWKGDPLDITSYFENKIKGQDVNDVFIAGAFGEFLHFNGISWKSYMNQIGLTNGAYLSVDARNKLVATTGYEGIQAKIIIGQKY
ncbi:MAG: hypothetical protein IPH11_07195 [Ignavibacteriales bacterium]|nr:hypothetical protein [Ignavibacteriales bacterium]